MLQQYLECPPDLLAFDYETTGLKPYKKGHEIICCGVCSDKKESYVFEFTPKLTKWWKQILKDRKIKKTAHNIKFEHQWSRNILGVEVRRWVIDSMVSSHILDNRKGIVGLKFQAYVNFGQGDYSSHLDKFLGSEEKGFNKIKDAPREELLHYCGMDSLLQFRLAEKHMEEL